MTGVSRVRATGRPLFAPWLISGLNLRAVGGRRHNQVGRRSVEDQAAGTSTEQEQALETELWRRRREGEGERGQGRRRRVSGRRCPWLSSGSLASRWAGDWRMFCDGWVGGQSVMIGRVAGTRGDPSGRAGGGEHRLGAHRMEPVAPPALGKGRVLAASTL